MANTDIDDATDRVPAGERVRRPSPVVVCELQRLLVGTFCFPLPELHCGGSITIEKGESRTLNGSFSTNGVSIGGEVTVTSKITYSLSAGKCEVCEPEWCFENSQLQKWECEKFVDYYSWTTHDIDFIPGQQAIHANCRDAPQECNCDDEQAMIPGERETFASIQSDALTTRLVIPVSFRKRPGDRETDPETDLAEASQHVEEFQRCGPSQESRPASVVIAQPEGRRVVIGGPDATDSQLALLSMDARDIETGEVRVRRDRELPILAVGPRVPDAKATVRLHHESGGSTTTVLEEEALTETGTFTTIWRKLQIPDGTLQEGDRGQLSIDLRDEDGVSIASICQKIKMPLTPRGKTGTSSPEESVTVIDGIGVAYSERLSEAGITTITDLAAADAEELATEIEISEQTVRRWIERAEAIC